MQINNGEEADIVKKPSLFKDFCLEALLGFSFALLMAMAYFGSGFELEFIYQGF